MNIRMLGIGAVLSTLVFATGCGDGRDVKVTGEIATDPGVEGDTSIRVEVFEPKTDDAAKAADATAGDKLSYVDAFDLDAPGSFEQTLAIEGDSFHMVAVADRNDNGKCDAGEAWGETDVEIADDDTAEVTLRISAHAACPDVPAAE